MRSVNEIDFQTASGNELFVLGRNIYQAADGNCYACHRFIDGFSETGKSASYFPGKKYQQPQLHG